MGTEKAPKTPRSWRSTTTGIATLILAALGIWNSGGIVRTEDAALVALGIGQIQTADQRALKAKEEGDQAGQPAAKNPWQ